MSISGKQRVLSGMRPTGQLHLGHYHGVLKNWLKLQQEYECFFFVADWHALTTEYENPSIIEKSAWDMVIDWLDALGMAASPDRQDQIETALELMLKIRGYGHVRAANHLRYAPQITAIIEQISTLPPPIDRSAE